MLKATRRQIEVAQVKLLTHIEISEGYETAFKEKLEEAYNKAYFTMLKDNILEFMHITAHEMPNRLSEKCLALTSREKEENFTETNILWDLDDDLATYFVKLDHLGE